MSPWGALAEDLRYATETETDSGVDWDSVLPACELKGVEFGLEQEAFSWCLCAGRDLGHELVQRCVLHRNLSYSFSISFAYSSDRELLT